MPTHQAWTKFFYVSDVDQESINVPSLSFWRHSTSTDSTTIPQIHRFRGGIWPPFHWGIPIKYLREHRKIRDTRLCTFLCTFSLQPRGIRLVYARWCLYPCLNCASLGQKGDVEDLEGCSLGLKHCGFRNRWEMEARFPRHVFVHVCGDGVPNIQTGVMDLDAAFASFSVHIVAWPQSKIDEGRVYQKNGIDPSRK